MNAPCSDDPELWMSGLRADQREAAQKCRVLCPAGQLDRCRDEGWSHEFGVWGGMSPADRMKQDPVRFRAGLSKRKELSDHLDDLARAMAKGTAELESKNVLPESQRKPAPPPMTRAERVSMRWHREVHPCAVDECEDRATRRGWCVRHYHRWRNTGDPLGKNGKL